MLAAVVGCGRVSTLCSLQQGDLLLTGRATLLEDLPNTLQLVRACPVL